MKLADVVARGIAMNHQVRDMRHITSAYLFPTRTIGNGEALGAEEQGLVSQLLQNKKVRIGAAILLGESADLSQSDRLGLLYFISLSFNADDLLDGNATIKAERNEDRLRTVLLSSQTAEAPITLEEVMQRCLSHVTPSRRPLVSGFLDRMISYHAELGSQEPGAYSYDDALAYRRQTNDDWVNVLCELSGISDPKKIATWQRRGLLIQMIDDASDWEGDTREGTYNLWIGLAREYPDEFAAMVAYTKEQQSMPRREFMQRFMPHTYQAYSEQLQLSINDVPPGLMRRIYRHAGRKAL